MGLSARQKLLVVLVCFVVLGLFLYLLFGSNQNEEATVDEQPSQVTTIEGGPNLQGMKPLLDAGTLSKEELDQAVGSIKYFCVSTNSCEFESLTSISVPSDTIRLQSAYVVGFRLVLEQQDATQKYLCRFARSAADSAFRLQLYNEGSLVFDTGLATQGSEF